MKQWKAGDLVWVDEKGFPTSTGGSFSGVIVYTPPFIGEGEGEQAKELQVAYSGVAPVRVEGGIPVNGMVMGTPGDHIGRKTGSVAIGRMMHGEATPTTSTGEVLAMVQLGGGGESEKIPPLTIVSSKPVYIPQGTEIPEDHVRIYLTWGTVNGRVATNWSEGIDVPTASDVTKYVFIKATFAAGADDAGDLKVSEARWSIENTQDAIQTPDWGSRGERPAYAAILLGQVAVREKAVHIMNSAGGSILLSDYVHNISTNDTGGVMLKKRLAHVRLTY